MKRTFFTRRRMLLGTGALIAAGVLKPRDVGQNHSAWFEQLSDALRNEAIARPTLIIDKTQLLNNIQTLQQHLNNRFQYRIVAKSLPSVPLLKLVMEATRSSRLMLFHQRFVEEVARQIPLADVLLGKPMPVTAAENIYRYLREHAQEFDHRQQLQWLIDSTDRLEQYQQLAERLQTSVNINIELDVGLHRGGVSDTTELRTMLQVIEADDRLTFSGLMGYEPHVAKLPGSKETSRDNAQAVYRRFVECTEDFLERSVADLTLNCGGSPTYQLYDKGDYCFNELSAGSCLVKPTDFDIETLEDHVPASYIAAPVLKAIDENPLPLSYAAEAMRLWNPNRQQSFFIYGGYWKAVPTSPQGLSINPIMGRSTNQEMLNGSASIDLRPDDYVFLRPTQSEFVFLQFGDIAVYEDGRISESWPVLRND